MCDPTNTVVNSFETSQLPRELIDLSKKWQAQLHGNVDESENDSHSGVVWRPKEFHLWLYKVDSRMSRDHQCLVENAVAKIGLVTLKRVSVDGHEILSHVVAFGSLMAIEQGKGFGSKLVRDAEVFAQTELGAHIAILGCAESTVPFYQRLGWEICPDAEQLYSPLGTDSCQKLPWVDKILVRMVGDRDDIQIQMDIDRFRNAQTLNVHGLPI